MKQQILWAICLMMFSTGCKNTPKNTENTVQIPEKAMEYPTPTFLLNEYEDTILQCPKTIISLAYKSNITVVDTVIGAFNFMTAPEIKQTNIPKTAILSGKSFWAGLETTVVIDSLSTGYVVKKKYEDESTDGKEAFEDVKSFPK